MGWTTMRKPDDVAKWFRDTLTWKNENCTNTVLDTAIVNRSVGYAAVETVHSDGKREVWAAVFLLKFYPNDKDGYTFGYKDMSEEMGPVEASCPARILDLLTETDRENSIDWRRRCRARLANRERNRLSDGDFVQFERPIKFTNGDETDTFVFSRVRNRELFRVIDRETGLAGDFVRITGWRDRTVHKLTPEEVADLTRPIEYERRAKMPFNPF